MGDNTGDLFQKADDDFTNTDPNQVDNVVAEDTDNAATEQPDA